MSLSERKNSSFKECACDASSSISTFVIKIFNLLNDPENAQAICWHQDGASFLIKDIPLLTNRVLPVYFRHNNYQSFIRQLNMYSFTKLKDHHVHRFRNPHFLRDQEENLKLIKRKPEKKKRRQSDESIESQKENELRGSTESNQLISMQQKEPKCTEIRLEAKIQEEVLPIAKKVRFEEAVKGGNSDENISSIIQATSKWINNKEESCWGNIKSTKSIELSMKLIGNDEEDEMREKQSGRTLGHSTLQHPIILLFNPNLSERTIKSIGNIPNTEE